MLRVGIPKEIKSLEKRVGLVPSAVKALCGQGVEVLVQQNAGEGSGYTDRDYFQAGARLVPDAARLYAQADLIQKVKEPLAPEFEFLRKGQILFGFLHLASPENHELVQVLIRSGVTAIGYETVEKDGVLPLLAPMSEIAGALAGAYSAILKSGIGIQVLEETAAKFPDFKGLPPPGKVVIFGGGVAGFKALETVLCLKGEVFMIEKDPQRREYLKRFTPQVFSPEEKDLGPILEAADALIGCVHARGTRAFRILDEKTLEKISRVKKKMMIDIAIDQGGNFSGSRSTTYRDSVYRDVWGNLRFCVPNIPSLCGRGASEALSRASLPYTQALARGLRPALQQYPELLAAINIEDGAIKIPAIREIHQS